MYRWIGLFLLAACGGPVMSTGGVGGGSASVGGGGTCCLNGSFYDCQSKAAFDQCAGFDPGACHAACSVSDFACQMACDTKAANATHDPSACVRSASRDSECSTGGSGGSCVGSRGVACTYSTQCSSGNCHDGHCYARSNGNPCDYSTQCDSNNCTNGCCSGNAQGNACTYSTQCTSANCTNGKCQ